MKKYMLLFVILAAILISGCSFSLAADITPPPGAQAPVIASAVPQQVSGPLYPLVPPDPTAGKALFTEKCAPCHGSAGLGDGPQAAGLPNPVAALGTPELARNATPGQWYMVVTQGNMEKFMPPFPSLNDRQRWDVIAYAFSLSEPAASLEQAKQNYQENCAVCHGETGKGDGPQAAGLRMPNFTDQEKMAGLSSAALYQSISEGKAPDMPAWGDKLSEDERWGLAAYLRSLTFSTTGELAAVASAAGDVTPVPEAQATAVATPTVNTGVISGSVTNASQGELPVGIEVMLHGFDQMQMVVSKTTTLDPNGDYTFPGIEMPDGRMFFTSLQHQGATYGSEVGTVSGGQTELDLPIAIYDTTQDLSTVKIDRLHLFFEQLDEQTMRVAELVVMSNTGEKTIIPAKEGQPVLPFKLPEGFSDLQFQSGDLGGRFVQTADGFADTTSIYPGQGNYQILFAYTLPYERKLAFSQEMTLPADAVVVLAPQESFKIKGDHLEQAGTKDLDGVAYQMYNLSNVKAGDELNLTLSNAFSLGGGTRTGLVIGLAALGLVLIAGGVWTYMRSRRNGDLEDDETSPKEDEVALPGARAETPEELMDAILALDDYYHTGKITEEAYLERRAELKGRLKDRMDGVDQAGQA